mmetsp:Transcript_14082/g.16245  ORF Transcript_14082/g.16245 Transcript_14082/m.16245 type:complete len:194 (-) Transcript_14082:204-785(-)
MTGADFTLDNTIDPRHTISIVVYAIITTSLAEFFLWILFYKKEEYKSLKKNIDALTLKVSKQKEQFVTQSQAKAHEKKIGVSETQLKNLNQEMTAIRTKSTLLIGVFMIIMIGSLGTEFQGISVATLPFEPISLVRGITHRGLIGENYTECSYMFIYIVVSYIWRANIQKIFGFEGPKSPFGSFMNPTGQRPF